MSPPLKQNCHLWRIDLSLSLLPPPPPASTHNHKLTHGPKNMGVAWDIIQSLTEVQSGSKFTFMTKGTHPKWHTRYQKRSIVRLKLVFSCTSLVKILDVAKFHLTLLQEPDPVHSPSVVVKEKWQNVETLVVLLTVCMSMRGIGNVKREALKEFGNGNGNCTVLNGKKWDLKLTVTETLRSKKHSPSGLEN